MAKYRICFVAKFVGVSGRLGKPKRMQYIIICCIIAISSLVKRDIISADAPDANNMASGAIFLNGREPMKIDLEVLLKALGWPVGLVAVLAASLALFGIELEKVLILAGSLLGAQALFSLLIDVLKWTGVVTDGNAGKWSAGFNLILIVGVAVAIYIDPAFDFPALDAQLVVIVKFLSLIFGYITQLVGTKSAHRILTRGLGVRSFSYSMS